MYLWAYSGYSWYLVQKMSIFKLIHALVIWQQFSKFDPCTICHLWIVPLNNQTQQCKNNLDFKDSMLKLETVGNCSVPICFKQATTYMSSFSSSV